MWMMYCRVSSIRTTSKNKSGSSVARSFQIWVLPGPGVIGSQGSHHIPIEVSDLAVQVARSQPDADQRTVQVILREVGRPTHRVGNLAAGGGHDLHQAARPGPGFGKALKQALLAHHGEHQQRVEVFSLGVLQYQVFEIDPEADVIEISRGGQGGKIIQPGQRQDLPAGQDGRAVEALLQQPGQQAETGDRIRMDFLKQRVNLLAGSLVLPQVPVQVGAGQARVSRQVAQPFQRRLLRDGKTLAQPGGRLHPFGRQSPRLNHMVEDA